MPEVVPLPSPAEWAAYIGAAAWLPQIGSWVYGRLVTPKVRIIPERSVQLGYTTFGPIFNIRVSISTDRKDAIVNNLEVDLTHQDGAAHSLRWSGLRETFSEVMDSEGNRQSTIEKDQPAIALKVSTALLAEKFVRFQDQAWHNEHNPLFDALVSQYNYLKSSTLEYRQSALTSKEHHSLFEFYKRGFWWKAGRYEATFRIQSPNDATLNTGTFVFFVSQFDVDSMRANIDLMKDYYENVVMGDTEGYVAKNTQWSFRNVMFLPHQDADLLPQAPSSPQRQSLGAGK